jgi:RNA ligase (TIGR02306 family)
LSTHAVNIVEIESMEDHPNADRLGIVKIGGWTCVVAKGQFKPGDRAVYIEPDYVVPTNRPEFEFLKKGREDRTEHRMKAVRLRGQLSFGLLIPVPADVSGQPTGSNVMEVLNIRRYDPPVQVQAGGFDDALPEADWPQVYAPKFDVEDLRKHDEIFTPGELVIVTEKIHGGNCRVVSKNGILYIGSRGRWLKLDVKTLWTRALANTPNLAEWCAENDGTVLYGEVYGPVQELKYGLVEPQFAAFAAVRNDKWIDQGCLHASLGEYNVPYAPVLYVGPYDRDFIAGLAEDDSNIPTAPKGHMMEGVVIVPQTERRHENLSTGRVALKLISNRYWES